MNDIAERVHRGIAPLDRNDPGWRERVNPETLDIGNSDICVLGQCYGSYEEGVALYGLSRVDAACCGFVYKLGTADFVAEHRELTEHWKALIRARRMADEAGTAAHQPIGVLVPA